MQKLDMIQDIYINISLKKPVMNSTSFDTRKQIYTTRIFDLHSSKGLPMYA